ncbi:hypothetical protein ACIBQ1_09470 [Nonomuraea sp. NPDC050153]
MTYVLPQEPADVARQIDHYEYSKRKLRWLYQVEVQVAEQHPERDR